MKPLVSIIIPCYNAERWVGEAIQSCLTQTHKAIEVIVVEDGSRDNSLKAIAQFQASNIKIISQENRGNGAARNRGLAEAQGDFIQYLDADDLLAPDKIEVQIRRLQEAGGLCVASGMWLRFVGFIQDAVSKPEPIYKDLTPIEWIIADGMMACHAWLVPRSVAAKAGRWNETLRCNLDGEYFIRVVLASSQVLFCPAARAYYRSGIDGSVSSRSRSSEGMESLYESFKLCVDHMLTVENSPRTRQAAARIFQRFVYNTYPDRLDLVKCAEAKVSELGGCNFPLVESRLFNCFSGILGWKAARRLQRGFRRQRQIWFSTQSTAK